MSYVVTAKLICVFVFAYAKSRFSHDEAHLQAKLYCKNNMTCFNFKVITATFVASKILRDFYFPYIVAWTIPSGEKLHAIEAH